jgi:hypothetical protein
LERKARIKRYPWSKGQPQGPFRKAVRSRRPGTKMTFFRKFILSSDLFLFLVVFFCSCQSLSLSRFAPLTCHLPGSLTGCGRAPTFERACPIFSPTPLHLPSACCALSSPLTPTSPPRTHAFWLAIGHWNCAFSGSGSVFRAGFLPAGSPPFPAHA